MANFNQTDCLALASRRLVFAQMMVGGRIEAAIPDNTFRPERRDHAPPA